MTGFRQNCGRPLLMVALNATPDSFVPGTRITPADAAERVRKLLDLGADIIDIGAVSARPGAAPVSEDEEWARLKPVLEALKEAGLLNDRDREFPKFSIDTTRTGIIQRVSGLAGRVIVNDITAGDADPGMLRLAARERLPYVAMHSRGTPRTMDCLCDYPDGVVQALVRYFEAFAQKAAGAGLEEWILDPGFGFAKTPEQNLDLLENLREFRGFGVPVLAGIADKRFADGRTAELERIAAANGADILRIHEATLTHYTKQA